MSVTSSDAANVTVPDSSLSIPATFTVAPPMTKENVYGESASLRSHV
jgi:hypothetical protein